jgi:DNA polymerase III subunit epsilon
MFVVLKLTNTKSMEKLFFYDLETTGVQYWRNGIHQIAGAIVIDGELKERFDFKVCPHPKAIIEAAALEVGHVTEEQILSYPKMDLVYKQLIAILSKYVNKFDKADKFHLVGYNINGFDNPFFRAFFVQNEDKYFGSWFWADSIDCYVLASHHFRKERSKFLDFKQQSVAKYLGISVDEAKLHDAEYDIELCMEIYKRLS